MAILNKSEQGRILGLGGKLSINDIDAGCYTADEFLPLDKG